MNRLPPRVLVGLGVTLIAVLLLVGVALRGDQKAKPDGQTQATPKTTSTSTSTIKTAVAEQSTTTTSIKVLPDWYPKGSSRYSDRAPVVTVTTLPPTTTTTTKKSSSSTSSSGSNSSVAGN